MSVTNAARLPEIMVFADPNGSRLNNEMIAEIMQSISKSSLKVLSSYLFGQ
ncbi:MAG: hypothetical protein IJ523_04005 [Succinivibrionaceae bacterium]|nr:hypothetical protein [Succinivibrionaceae bacterium]